MKVSVVDFNNKAKSDLSLNADIFGAEYRADILSRVVVWQQAKARSGNHQTKGRSDVAGTTKKAYKQKGTGGARHGAKTAPIFVGGGVVFGPHKRDHSFSLNKKVRKLGLKIALSLKLKEKSIIVLENFDSAKSKTKDLATTLKSFDCKSGLFIDSSINEELKQSASNLKGFDTLSVSGLNVLDLLKHDKLFISAGAIKAIEERLAC